MVAYHQNTRTLYVRNEFLKKKTKKLGKIIYVFEYATRDAYYIDNENGANESTFSFISGFRNDLAFNKSQPFVRHAYELMLPGPHL